MKHIFKLIDMLIEIDLFGTRKVHEHFMRNLYIRNESGDVTGVFSTGKNGLLA